MSAWLSKEQVMEATGWSKRWVEAKASSGELATRTGKERGRNGKFPMEYSVASLPEEARVKLAGEDTPAAKQTDEAAILVAPLFAGRALQSSSTRVALIDPRDKERAAKRLAIIQPLLEYRAAAQGSPQRTRFEQLRLGDGRAVTTVDLLTLYLATQHGTSVPTIYRWVAAFEKNGGDVALADKRRADKNQSRWAVQNPDLAKLAAYVHLEEQRSARVAWETVCARAQELGGDAPSYETVRAFLKERISPSIRTLALEGRQAYERTFAPYLRRGFTDVASNEIWVSDHMIHDTLVQNDIFPPNGGGACDLRHIRLQMTTLLDYHSRYVAGVSWSEVGSSRSIATAVRHAVMEHGLPYGFYCDNGKDYRKVAKGARPQELVELEQQTAEAMRAGLRPLLDDGKGSGILSRLKIPVTYCIPYHPQSKHVERYHNTVHDRFDKLFLTYTGGAAHLRPDRTSAALAQHKGLRMLKKKGVVDNAYVAGSSALPLASEYIQMFLAWLRDYYHATPQRGEGMDGRSPAEVFQADRWKEPRPMPTREQVVSLMLERELRKVDSCAIRLHGRRYVPPADDIFASAVMHELTTQDVVVAYDPCDLEAVAILDADGHLLCELQAEVLMRQSADAETQGLIAESMQQRRILHRATRDSLADLSRSVKQGGHISGAEALRQIAQLPAAVGDATVQRPQRFRPSEGAATAPPSSWDIASNILEELK